MMQKKQKKHLVLKKIPPQIQSSSTMIMHDWEKIIIIDIIDYWFIKITFI